MYIKKTAEETENLGHVPVVGFERSSRKEEPFRVRRMKLARYFSQRQLQYLRLQELSILQNIIIMVWCTDPPLDPLECCYRDMTSVCNLLVQEFMSGILRITNDAVEDDVSELQAYLLEGHGLGLLQVIQKIGVKELSNIRNFANLLVSLLPWCLKFKVSPKDHQHSSLKAQLILHSLIKICGDTRNSIDLVTHNHPGDPVSLAPLPLFHNSCCSAHYKDDQALSMSRKKLLVEYMLQENLWDSVSLAKRGSHCSDVCDKSTSDSETPDANENQKSLRMAKPERRKKHRIADSYMVSWQSRYNQLSEESLMEISVLDAPEFLHPAELCRLMISLMQDISVLDLGQASPSKVVSIFLLPKLFDVLESFHIAFEEATSDSSWHQQLIAYILRHLIRLTFTLNGIVALQKNGPTIIMNNKVFSVLLSLAHVLSDSVDWSEASVNSHIRMPLVADLVIGLVTCAAGILQNTPFNPVFINNVLRIIKTFQEEGGFRLLELTTMWYDSSRLEMCSSFSKFFQTVENPIKAIGLLIITLKKMKVGYIHALTCLKRKHRKCIYTHCFDHHHDVLGSVCGQASPTSKTFNGESCCLVGYWSKFLLDVLPQVKSKTLQLQILTSFLTAGICCCLGVATVVSNFYICFPLLSPAMKNYAMDVLNKILLEQLSGSRDFYIDQSKNEICQVCEVGDYVNLMTGSSKQSEENTNHSFCNNQNETQDSGISSSEFLSEDLKPDQMPLATKWGSLKKLRSILYSGDVLMASLLAKHLLVLAVNGRQEIKRELFFSVYLPILTDFCQWSRFDKVQSSSKMASSCPVPKSVVMHCLSAFPYLLQVDHVMAAFLNQQGIGKLCAILEDDSLQELALHVFEALIITDEEMHSYAKVTPAKTSPLLEFSSAGDELELGNNTVIRAFLKILTNKVKLYGAALDIIPGGSCSADSIQIDGNRNCEGHGEKCNNCHKRGGHKEKWLSLIVNLWRTCQVLLLNSQMFLMHFKMSVCFQLSNDILFHVIPQLALFAGNDDESVSGNENKDDCSQNLQQFQQILKLLECVLVGSIVCQTESAFQKSEEENLKRMMTQVKSSLLRCFVLDKLKLQMVFDMLLNCARPDQTTILELSSLHSLLMYSKEEDLEDEEEVRQLLNHGSEDEQEMLCTEYGYDADSEYSMSDDVRVMASKTTQVCAEFGLNRTNLSVVYRLLLELLVQLQKNPAIQPILNHVLYRLVQVCREDQHAIEEMCSEGLMEIILQGFKSQLVVGKQWKTDTKMRSCAKRLRLEKFCEFPRTTDLLVIQQIDTQQLLFTLMELLAQNCLSAKELKLILRFFIVDDPPVDILLSMLTAVVENYKVTPQFYICFPIIINHLELSHLVSPDKELSLLAEKSTTNQPESSMKHLKVWNLAPVCLPLPGYLSWPPYQNGFSLSFWIELCEEVAKNRWVPGNKRMNSRRTQPLSDSFDSEVGPDMWMRSDPRQAGRNQSYIADECLHVLSIGTKEKMFEIWTEPCSGTLVIRLTSELSKETSVLKQCSAPGLLSTGRWHYVVLRYVEVFDDGALLGKVSIVLNGWWSQEMILDQPANIRLTDTDPSVYVGHCIKSRYPWKDRKKACQLGALMLFKGTNLTQDVCFHLYCLGPNCTTIVKCDCSDQRAAYSPHLSKNTVCHSGIHPDVLAGMNPVNLDPARSSLILSYSPRSPRVFCLYGPIGRVEVPTLSTALGILHSPALSSELLEQQPRQSVAITPADIVATEQNSLEMAIEETGGVGIFLFLVAKVFEGFHPKKTCHDSSDALTVERMEKRQANSLHLLFQLTQQIPQLALEYEDIQGDRLISRILESSKSRIGFRILKVLLNAATTEAVLKFDAHTRTFTVRQHTRALIRNMSVIKNLLLSWRIWMKAKPVVMETLFSALALLVHENHPHQEFNIKQYQAGNFANQVFLMYQELVRESLPLPSPTIGKSVVLTVQKLVGSPPDSHLIVAICDFLLLMHPAANTYINYSRSGFYFNCHWAFLDSPQTEVKPRQHKKSNSQWSFHFDKTDKRDLSRTRSFANDGGPTYERQIRKRRSLTYPVLDGAAPFVDFDKLPEWKTCKDKNNYAEKTLDFTSRPNTKSELKTSADSSSHGDIESNLQSIKKMYGSSSSSISSNSSSSSLSQEDSLLDMEGEDLTSLKDLPEDDKLEKGLVVVCSGLLNLLCSTVVLLPDAMLDQMLRKVVKPEVLVVLARSSSMEIRVAIVKLVDIYLQRSRNNHLDVFLKMNGFHLLSAQLYHYLPHKDIAEAVLSIFFSKPFSLDSTYGISQLSHLTHVQQSSSPLVLSLLEKSVGDLALCHNLLCVTIKIFEVNPMLSLALMDNGITETLCNLLARINASDPRPTDIKGVDERQILIEDLQQIFAVMGVREFSLSGVLHYQLFEDMMNYLKALEEREKLIYGLASPEADIVKNMQLNIIQHVLTFVEQCSGGGLVTMSTGFYSYQKANTDGEADLGNSLSTSGESTCSVDSSQQSLQSRKILPLEQHRENFLSNVSHLSIFLGQKKKGQTSRISLSELSERLKKVIVIAVDFVVYSDKMKTKTGPEQKITFLLSEPAELITTADEFQRRLLDFLFKALELLQERGLLYGRKNKNAVLSGAKDVLQKQCSRLLLSMVSPREGLLSRVSIVSYLVKELKRREVFKVVFSSSQLATQLFLLLHDLLTTWRECLSSHHHDNIHCLLALVQKSGMKAYMESLHLDEEKAKFEKDLRVLMDQSAEEEEEWLKKRQQVFNKILYLNKESLIKRLSESAMEVTQLVTKLQNHERKEFVSHVKQTMTDKIQIKKVWQDLVQQLTHERAVWFFSESYPRSWQLDPTEGPFRIRRRFQRCNLMIPEKFITPEFRYKLEPESVDPPLIYLFEDDHQTSDSAALIYRLYTNEKIQFTSGCTTVSPSAESKGELLIGETNVYFVADEAMTDANYTQVLLGNKDQLSMTWPHLDIKEILPRWYQLKDVGLEIFLTNGKTCLLAFQATENRNQVVKHLEMLELPNLIKGENLSSIQQLWLSGRMTNFEYLTHLNKIAGRSFNDLMQYPIFPFVLKDYTSSQLDLTNSEVYRDLFKPIAVQEKSREKKYVENYQYLKQEHEKFQQRSEDASYRVAPYHYGSHYSNSGTVLHFLVRLPPFTKIFLSYQDQHFDLPDRMFHDVVLTWKLSSYQSTSDVKELIPEFYFLPEMFKNNEGFDFGTKQTGDLVWDVVLPHWCRGDARLFIFIHRQVLESALVCEQIHHWINLVLGFKQQGEAAVQAINVFHPATYFGVDVDSEKDPLHRQALLTMIKTYGQTPKQLFRQPHPQLTPQVISQIFSSESGARRSPLAEVKGLRWGNYVGSPDCSNPAVAVWKQIQSTVVASLVSLPTGEVFGIREDSCLLSLYSKERGITGINTANVIWAAIVSWGLTDGILRITNNWQKNSVNFLQPSPYDQITCCASVPDCRLLFTGGSTGVITAYTTTYNTAKKSHLQVFGSKRCLYGHTGPITALKVCKSFSVLVSASQDCSCIIWDLNRLCYVRCIENHAQPLVALAVSETLGDIASVCHKDNRSILQLHTINAELVQVRTCDEEILCLAYSTAPEGRSVNVIAGGLNTGVVRLWSSWTLEPVRDLNNDMLSKPILSLAFTHDSQHLCVSAADGMILIWENTSAKPRTPRLILFL